METKTGRMNQDREFSSKGENQAVRSSQGERSKRRATKVEKDHKIKKGGIKCSTEDRGGTASPKPHQGYPSGSDVWVAYNNTMFVMLETAYRWYV